jgi:2',3'-cyclic-nucleotide 2'-phosphodiesterase (5'-nucleotidase family)
MSDSPGRGPSLRIVSVNDVYTLENLPRLLGLVRHHAESSPAEAMICVMAGDFLAPSILSSLDAGRAMIECMNLVGFTHAILGNHEDDIPTAALRDRLRELRATLIDTNVRGLDAGLPTHAVVEVARTGGRRVRVGIVGVVMDDEAVYRRAPFGGASLVSANTAALAEAARLLAEERCACVVPITHQPIDDDRALARAPTARPREAGRGQDEAMFPIIVGGHEHVVFVEQVEGTWIVKAGSDAVRAVVADLVWPADPPPAGAADLPAVTVRVDEVAHYPEDADLRARVDRHMARVRDLEQATLVKLPPGKTLSSVGGRAQQTSVGTLVCSSVRDALDADACVFNGGGIRACREYPSHFTYGDVRAELPFDNEVVVVRMPGSVLRDAVATSRAHAPAESGGFLQVDDRTIVEEPAHLVASVAGAPLDLGRDYRVALVRDLMLGMDHIEPLVRFARDFPERMPPAGSGREVKLVLVDAFSVALWKQLGGFDAVDANHDGVVTAAEVETAVAAATGEAPSPVTAELLIHALDADHDHVISRSEADAAMDATKPRPR